MKKVLFFLFLLSFVAYESKSQKFGYIDTEYITSKMPAYQEAIKSMNDYSQVWIAEIKKKSNEVDKLKADYQQEEILLTEEMKKQRLKAIDKLEDDVKEMNNNVFGLDGQLFQKKKEILKPIMDQVYVACEKVAREKKLMFIFDKASDLSMIYTDPRHDYTDYVMEALGLKEKE